MVEVGPVGLRNCPFCDEALEVRNSGNPYGRHHKDSECIIASMAVNIPGDVERWNRRAPDPERDELQEAPEGMRPETEIIIAAAILCKGLIVTLPPLARHHTILHPLTDIVGEVIGPDEQGFLTSKGRFVGLIEARDIAVQVMGIKPDNGWHLFSEDLW